ncbi:MAG TPA: hypothetical protein VEU47_12880, partial [Candidatus Cybelea sp.]|nr:hypothetical protein [Candidatus Cybelea sp.]
GAPAERVTPEAVAAYLAALRKQVNERTVLIRLDDLYIAIAAMAPGDDWTWFQLARSRLRRRQPPARAKGARLADPPELLAAACTAMDELLAQPRMTQWKRVRYRDLLMVALLTSRPIRRRNFASLEIGRHLARQGAGWKLRLEATETFNHRAYEAVLPAALTQYLEIYLEQIRPMLLCGASSERLWINWRGGDLDERSFWLRLTLQTSALTGKSQSPELFRAAAAAAIARQDPNHAGVVREVLGNASIDAAENLADRSRRIDAGRTYREAITALRNRPNRSARRKS